MRTSVAGQYGKGRTEQVTRAISLLTRRRSRHFKTLSLVMAMVFVMLEPLMLRGPLGIGGSGAGEAQAAIPKPDKRVALFTVGKNRNDKAAAKALQTLLRGELEKLDGYMVVGPNADSPVSAARAIGPLVETGYRALNARQGVQAVKSFRDALSKMSTYRGPFDKRLLARTLKGLAVASVLTGEIDAAQDMMFASLNLWPDQQAAEYGWTLDAKNDFRDVQRRSMEIASGSIEVTAEPEGAAIHVGGELKGFSPVVIENLPAGKHWVEASVDGFYRNGSFVDILPGEGGIHVADLEPTKDKRQFSAALKNATRLIRSPTIGAPLSNLQRLAVADSVVMLSVDQQGESYVFAGWSRTGSGQPKRLSTSVKADDDLLFNLRNFLATSVGSDGSTVPEPLPLDGPPQASVMANDDIFIDPNDPIFATSSNNKSESSVTDEWWFWALVGGVTAGLVVGGIVLFSGEDAGTGPTGNVVVNLNALQ